jgi:hypothetical protein
VACGAARGERDLGRACERFKSERHQHSERPRALRLSEGRLGTAVTVGTVPVTAGTATDHGGHVAGHNIHSAGYSDPGDGGRTASLRSAAAAAVDAAAITIPSPGLAGRIPSGPSNCGASTGTRHARHSLARPGNARVNESQMTPAWEHGAGAKFIICYQPLPSSGRMRPLPGRPSSRRASAKRRCSSTSCDLSLCCGARSQRWCPHGVTTAAKDRLLHLLKSTAMTARRCALPRS